MQERIERFAEELKGKNHILQLVRNLDAGLVFETESEMVFLSFRDGLARIDNSMHGGTQIRIAGTEECFLQLFDGDIKLREGIRLNYFKMDCPFRLLLVLESIFFLARPMQV